MKFVLLVVMCCLLNLGANGQEKLIWSTYLDNLGSFSSPRATDLNNDGIKDIVFGAGRKEFIETDSSIVAIDGKTGSVIWTAHAHDQVFGSCSFMDINNDNVQDVFINGRSGVLKALNGKTGETLWDFLPDHTAQEARGKGWYNFYNPQFIPDLNGDNVKDIVISNGGDVTKAPYDEDRPPGQIAVISGKDGKLINKIFVPDNRETYMSVVVHDFNSDGDLTVVFGTGGETIPGSLYTIPLKSILAGTADDSKMIATSNVKGFISPPVLCDLNGDATLDIVSLAVDGRIIAINGSGYDQLWTTGLPNTEGFASFGIGNFTQDMVPDFITTVNTGVWPEQEYAISLIVDGQSGTLLKNDTIGYYQMVSPITFDLNADNMDEVILHTNFPSYDQSKGKTKFTNMFVMYDFKNKLIQRIGPLFEGSNGASTPWLGDLDGDGLYDLVSIYQTDPYNESIFSGIQVIRLNLGIRIRSDVKWGSYMGSEFDGIYK